jgi:hypothetical protein
MNDGELVDNLGLAKAVKADAKAEVDKIRAELLKRYGTKAKRRKLHSLALEGGLFRATITWCSKMYLDTEAIRAYLGKRIKQFENRGWYFQVTTTSKTGVRQAGDDDDD